MSWLRATMDRLRGVSGPTPPDEEHHRKVGLGVAQMLTYGKDWVFRRTETFEFISASTVRRQVGVDFQLPRWPAKGMDIDTLAIDAMVSSCHQHGAPVHVPLLTLEKAKLTNVDVLDEDGRTLPLLTTAQNGHIGGYALLGVALGVAHRAKWTSVDGHVVDAIADVAKLPSGDAKLLLNCLRDGVAAHADAVAKRVSDGPAAPTSLATHAKNLVNLDEDAREQAKHLLKDNLLGNLAEKLANDFIVLVPLSGDPCARRVFKFRYEEPLSVPEGHREAPARTRAWWWVAERCSWRPKEFSFSRIPVGTTESHHVEMVAPENTDIVRGIFQAYTPPPPPPPPKPAGEPSGTVVAGAANGSSNVAAPKPDAVDRIDGTNPRRGHMQIRAVAPQAYATARVAFSASPAGLVNAALLVTLLNAFIFWAGLSHVDDVPQEDAAAAILLAGPTLLAVYIARPGEHELVSMMLSGVRAMVGASGFFMFLMAAGLAFGYNDENGVQVQDAWCWLRWPATALALGVGWSWAKVHWPTFPSNLRAHPRQAAAAVAALLFAGVVAVGMLTRPLLPERAAPETLNVPVWLGWAGLGLVALLVAALGYLAAARRLRAEASSGQSR